MLDRTDENLLWAAASRHRHNSGLSDAAVPRQQRNSMNDARGRDELVGGVSLEIKTGGLDGNSEIDRPDVERRQRSHNFSILQIHRYPAELDELREFPEHDRRDAPRIAGKYSSFLSCDFASKSKNQNVTVQVNQQRPTSTR